LASASEDEGLDGVDQAGRLAGARADPPQDFPALELGVCAFAGAAEPGVGGVDLLLVERERPVGAGLGIETAAPLRDGDRRAGALVGGVG
jgi:hypothetical protein